MERFIKDSGFPENLLKLKYSFHALERLKLRTTGQLIVAPKYLRLSPENTIDVKEKNGKVIEATVFIEYKKNILMFLPIVVSCSLVKTIYFKHVKKKQIRKREKRRLEEFPLTPKECFKKEEPSQECRTETTRKDGLGENVDNVSRDMGRQKTCRWKSILRTLRRMVGLHP